MKSRSLKTVIAMLVGAAVLLGANWLLERRILQDWVAGWGYAPSAAVAEIEGALELTGTGARIWAATNPTLEEAEAFNEYCDSHDTTRGRRQSGENCRRS